MTPDRQPPEPRTEPDTDAVGAAIRRAAATVQAPPSLRARLEDQRTVRARGWRTRLRTLIPAGAVVAAVAVALVLVTGGDGGPTLEQASALALAGPTAAAPAVVAGDPRLLDESVGDVPFPNYSENWPSWKTTGVRHDEIDGRSAVTVTYRGPKGDIGYTIVDGAPLDVPEGGRTVSYGGHEYTVLERDGATVITWEEGGHTCVLAGQGADAQQLLHFAAWA